MKKRDAVIFALSIFLLMLPACANQAEEIKSTTEKRAGEERSGTEKQLEHIGDGTDNQAEEGSRMIIEVNRQQFRAELYENDTAAALEKMLPLTLRMEELNGNEKYHYMVEELPADAEKIRTIQNGDIMLYGSDCLVLFFQTFNTSYSYTRIGYVEDAEEFAEALGRGTVEISFSMEKDEERK